MSLHAIERGVWRDRPCSVTSSVIGTIAVKLLRRAPRVAGGIAAPIADEASWPLDLPIGLTDEYRVSLVNREVGRFEDILPFLELAHAT